MSLEPKNEVIPKGERSWFLMKRFELLNSFMPEVFYPQNFQSSEGINCIFASLYLQLKVGKLIWFSFSIKSSLLSIAIKTWGA